MPIYNIDNLNPLTIDQKIHRLIPIPLELLPQKIFYRARGSLKKQIVGKSLVVWRPERKVFFCHNGLGGRSVYCIQPEILNVGSEDACFEFCSVSLETCMANEIVCFEPVFRNL